MTSKSAKVQKIEDEQINIYKQAFDMFDKKGNGTISSDDLYLAFKNMGNEFTMEQVEEMVRELDEDNSGEIDFEEFISLIKKVNENDEEDEIDAVIRAFKTFDRDRNGYLDCREFRYILTRLGDRFTDQEVDEIFKEADLNHDGKIEYEEFVSFWKNK
jgi:calmodulin